MKVLIALLLAQAAPSGLRTLDATQPVTYAIHDGNSVRGYNNGDSELAELALKAWSRESGGKLKFVRSDEQSAMIHVVWSGPNGGLFGETQQLEVGGKPGAVVFVMPDTRQLGEPLASAAAADPLLRDTIVYLTCVHELGHAVGLGHTKVFADIMYSFTNGGDFVEYFSRYRRQLKSRADISKFSGVSPADTVALNSLY